MERAWQSKRIVSPWRITTMTNVGDDGTERVYGPISTIERPLTVSTTPGWVHLCTDDIVRSYVGLPSDQAVEIAQTLLEASRANVLHADGTRSEVIVDRRADGLAHSCGTGHESTGIIRARLELFDLALADIVARGRDGQWPDDPHRLARPAEDELPLAQRMFAPRVQS